MSSTITCSPVEMVPHYLAEGHLFRPAYLAADGSIHPAESEVRYPSAEAAIEAADQIERKRLQNIQDGHIEMRQMGWSLVLGGPLVGLILYLLSFGVSDDPALKEIQDSMLQVVAVLSLTISGVGAILILLHRRLEDWKPKPPSTFARVK